MAQQTAVEWLHLKLKEWANLHSGFDTLFEQAKEMERQQAFEYFKAGQDSLEEGGKSFDQYYNETYGK
jgi:hypothetical protein